MTTPETEFGKGSLRRRRCEDRRGKSMKCVRETAGGCGEFIFVRFCPC